MGPAPRVAPSAGFLDVLALPVVGRVLRWPKVRLVPQLILGAFAVVLVVHGVKGPDLAPKNLATVLTWVHYRGVLVFALLVLGNVFCFGCPFLLPRELARRRARPRWTWPRRLRNKWVAVVAFALVLYTYEAFALWASPPWTAALIVLYFAAALVIDALFQHAPFCKYLCPIGQFNFVASAMSPLEVAVRDPALCASCRTKDCIKGRPTPPGQLPWPPARRGCELALYLPRKVGNMDCTFCLDCVHACPHDNVGIIARLPGSELMVDPSRAGVGRFSQRPDLAALVCVFAFGALANAFGMVAPVYALERWIAEVLGTTNRYAVLGVVFVGCLGAVPALAVGMAAMATRHLAGGRGTLAVATAYAYSLAPIGFGMWIAHYAFHFLTGALTFVPVIQLAARDLGWSVLGAPRWELGGLDAAVVYPLELGFLGLGLVGSWLVGWRLAALHHPHAAGRAFAPWALLHAAMFAAAIWLMSQPMDMRGTFLAG